MKTNSTGQNYNPLVKNSVKTAAKAAAIVTGLNAVFLPAEAKAAIKCSLISQDKYVKKAGEAAVKTIKNLEKSGNYKMAANINVREVIDKAKQIYPELSKTGKNLIKQLGKNFVVMAGFTAAASVILEKVFSKKQDK